MEAKYLSDNVGFKTGSAACVSRFGTVAGENRVDDQNGLGFLLTVVLFTQHLWTLAIAVATFLLLVSRIIPA
jgi:hypothetical protein